MSEPAFKAMSLEEYFRTEEHSLYKREYVGGFVYPLHAEAGVSQAHSRISMNIAGTLYPEARRQGCRLHQGEMRLQVNDALFYPDVMLACGQDDPPRFYEVAPCLLVEVISPSTASNDRVGKYALYTALASLQTYLIVEQTERRVVAYQREGNGWAVQEQVNMGEVHVSCLGLSLTLDDIYGGVL